MLAPSERYHQKLGRRHKKVTDWARQMVTLLRRCILRRPLVVGDTGYTVLDLLHFRQSLCEPVALIARLCLDAGLYDPAPPTGKNTKVDPENRTGRGDVLETMSNRAAAPNPSFPRSLSP